MKKCLSRILILTLILTLLPMSALADQYASVSGKWESVSFKRGNSTLNMSALVLDTPLIDCTKMTINMNVSMKYNTKCRSWTVLGRTNGQFEEIGTISLPSGNGSTSKTLNFSSPISVDAIAIQPNASGSFSWSMNFTLTNVSCKSTSVKSTTKKQQSSSSMDISKVQTGDIFCFGSYEQDNKLNNGSEPIEWIVLGKPSDGKSMVLLSRYCLDCVPFSKKTQDNTWETSYVRSWLNNTFLNKAFSEDEQQYLAAYYTETEDNPVHGTDGGKTTIDWVSLMSFEEVDLVFDSDTDRRCDATAYAKARGTQVYSTGAWWRLRSPGKFDTSVGSVYASGKISYDGDTVTDSGCGIRPMIMFSLPD